MKETCTGMKLVVYINVPLGDGISQNCEVPLDINPTDIADSKSLIDTMHDCIELVKKEMVKRETERVSSLATNGK